jgi:hypothetical protein
MRLNHLNSSKRNKLQNKKAILKSIMLPLLLLKMVVIRKNNEIIKIRNNYMNDNDLIFMYQIIE